VSKGYSRTLRLPINAVVAADAYLASGETRITCVVADDHPAVLRAVCDFLTEFGIEIVAKAKSAREAIDCVERFQPAVAVLDARMPEQGGFDTAALVSRCAEHAAVLIYTGFGDEPTLTESLSSGARGFVLKGAPLDELVSAIKMVAAGRPYVDPLLAGVIVRGGPLHRDPVLTRRERDVLRLLADGMRDNEIASTLLISTETVRTHVKKATAKLAAETRTQAVAEALRQSLIS
jgi:DNA-binding NarL/FixJ family response regulator